MPRPALRQRVCVLLATFIVISSTGWSCQAQAQGVPNNQLMFELLNRIEQLEREIRELRGDLEMYRYRQENLDRRLQGLEKGTNNDAAVGDDLLQKRQQQGASPGFSNNSSGSDRTKGIAAPAFKPSPLSPPGAAETVPLSPGEQADYDAAIDQLREGRYEQAISSLHGFLKEYPDSAVASDAHYWLGEAYYVNRDFAKSRQAFITMGTNYPNSRRLPSAMLKLGYVYEALGDKAKARQVLQQLAQSYPETQAAALAERRLQSLR